MSDLPKPFADVSIPEGLVWKYEAVIRGGNVEHLWVLTGESGGIHISARLSEWDGRKEWIGGIECHWASAPDYMDGEKPSHEHCWVLGKPCWHDGTSLGFRENVAPYLPYPHNPDPHDMRHSHGIVSDTLNRWFRNQIAEQEADA